MTELSCPENHSLVEFAAGRGEAELRDAIQTHLIHCSRCRQALELAAEATAEPGHLLADADDDSLLVAGPDLGRDVAETSLADQSTRLYQSPEELASRFDFALLEPPQQPGSLGHLGKCEVLEVLGFGGMGVVFRAQDEHLLRTVAIKVMSRDLATSATARRRFIREARAAAAINHPNVVTIHSVEEHNGTPFLVMEMLEGESLRDRLRHRPKLELLDVLNIAAQIAAGLAAAHAHGVIHRDIKPGNIMLQDQLQRVKITDFGLARVMIDNAELTSGEMGIGTPTYMSPEQVKGGQIDARSDLFALGCVIYAMLRGHSPFHGASTLEIARKVVDESPTPPIANNDVPAFLTEIIERLLQKSPDDRYQSAAEVADVLRRHLAAINQTPTGKLSYLLHPPPAKWRPARRLSSRIITGLTIGLCVLAIAAAWRWAFPGGERPVAGIQPTIASGSPGDDLLVPAQAEGAPLVVPAAPRVLTVSQSGPAEFTTISAALAKARQRDTIQILDSAEYRESIIISDAERHAGLTIAGNPAAPPTIFNPDSEHGALQIRQTSKVTIRGLKFRQTDEKQHAVSVGGEVSGTTLEDLVIEGDSRTRSLVYIFNARGTEAEPLVIRRSRIIAGQFIGIVIEGNAPPVAHVHVVENHFESVGTQAQVNIAAEGVRFMGNVFVGSLTGGIGLSFGLSEGASSRDLIVSSNTFFRCHTWLSLRNTSPEIAGVMVINNLILEPGENIITLADGRHSLEKFATGWSFAGNHAEATSPTRVLQRFARFQEHIEIVSRKADDPYFLRLVNPLEPAPSPLADLPVHVGALPLTELP